MSLTLHVDGPRWRERAGSVADAVDTALGGGPAGPGGTRTVVPVAKGNGYGLGNARLAAEAIRLGAGVLAVGTVFELDDVASTFGGDLLVLEPFDPRDSASAQAWSAVVTGPFAARVIRTLASREAVAAVLAEARTREGGQGARPRVVLEGLTSMWRFGLDEGAVDQVLDDPALADLVHLEGLALHLPLVQPAAPRRPAIAMLHDSEVRVVERGSARAREVVAWGLLWTERLAARLGERAPDQATTLWVSHLDDDELRAVRADLPDLPVRLRLGTRLWLGDRSLLRVTGTVLAVHDVPGGGAGYTQRGADRLVVVSGGTAHGISLAAPAAMTGIRSRVVAAGTGALEAVGRNRSPFAWQGRKLWLVEPPHMHVAQLRLDRGARAPAVGDELDVDVRFTTLRADRVVGLD